MIGDWEKMNGWKFDFTSLPHWDLRDSIPYVHDRLYENKSRDVAFLLYSIVECPMLNYTGRLAILENRKRPELLLLVKEGRFRDSPIVFSGDGRLAFAVADLWDGGWPIIVFAIRERRFASFGTVSNNAGYSVREIAPNRFIVAADKVQLKGDPDGQLAKLNGTEIDPDALHWKPFGEIDAFFARSRPSIARKSLLQRIRAFFFR